MSKIIPKEAQGKSLEAENEEIVGEGNVIIANAPEDSSPQLKLAVKLSEMNNANNQHLVGVLCTLIEASLGETSQAKALKDMVRRELYNTARDRVELIHSIVGRANVVHFREHPTLKEQSKQPSPDRYVFSKYE
jgi:hypothetical protein